MFTEINKFPFTEQSTLQLTTLEYTLPIGIFTDANFYPVCQNNAPFNIAEFIKLPDRVVATVVDNTGSSVFTISIPLVADNSMYCVGVGIQNGNYCGSCLCSKEAIAFFTSIPSIRDIPSGSLVFSASAVRPIIGNSTGVCYIKYDGKVVEYISWGDNLTGGTIETTTIELDGEKDKPINTIIVNNIPLTGANLFITPVKQGVIRVINSAGIAIGRLTDL